jgi:hypothetical protein
VTITELEKRRNWFERGGTFMNYNKGETLEYDYALTTYYDGELVNTQRYNFALDAVNDFNKCVDFGDAEEYATYNLAEPNGKLWTKNFWRDGKVTIK